MRDIQRVQEELGADFEVVRELGRGGASVVFLAKDRVLGRDVAVKVIDDRHVGDEEALARFRREARILAGLQHPNIVPIYGAKQLADGRIALMMRHMEGPTLRELLRREGRLAPGRAEQVLRDLGEALAYLHRQGIVHRDVKPENVYVEPDGGRALLSDFGIARPADGDSGLTLAGVVLGTPTYMAPEQIEGTWLNGQSDLYSLGMVGYEILSGNRPWAGESLYTIIYKQKNEYLPPLARERPEVPEHLREAVERALVKDRSLRWPSAEAFLRQLGTPAPASHPEPAVHAALATAAADEMEDLPTQVMRPAELAREVWRESASVSAHRVDGRRRKLAAAAAFTVLLLGGATAGAALIAKMGTGESSTLPEDSPARVSPSTPAAPPPEAPAMEPEPAGEAPVEPAVVEPAVVQPAAVEPAVVQPAPSAPAMRRERPAGPQRRRQPVRVPAPRTQRRVEPADSAPAIPAPPVRLLGRPVEPAAPVPLRVPADTVRTRPAVGVQEPSVTAPPHLSGQPPAPRPR